MSDLQLRVVGLKVRAKELLERLLSFRTSGLGFRFRGPITPSKTLHTAS